MTGVMECPAKLPFQSTTLLRVRRTTVANFCSLARGSNLPRHTRTREIRGHHGILDGHAPRKVKRLQSLTHQHDSRHPPMTQVIRRRDRLTYVRRALKRF